jgi:hypothetical protein
MLTERQVVPVKALSAAIAISAAWLAIIPHSSTGS